MNDLVIRRCDVRVVRRGGWSWGPDPDALRRRVLEALPALIEAHVAARVTALLGDRVLGEDEEVEILEPLTIDVSVSIADLLAGLPDPAFSPGAPAPAMSPIRSSSIISSSPGPASAEHAGTGKNSAAEPEAFDRLLARLAESGVLGRISAARFAALAGESTADGGAADRPAGATAQVTGGAAAIGRRTGEVEVASALPFLLAAALHRIGLLEALGPVLAADGLLDDAPLVAAALACKVLGPPHRGWLRTPQDVSDACAFAGLPPDGLDGAALAAVARRAGPALARWEGLLALSVCAGHPAGHPLLLAATTDGLLLTEPDGLFPIARAGDPATLLPHWEACDRPVLLLAGTTGPPGTAGRPSTAGPVGMTSRPGTTGSADTASRPGTTGSPGTANPPVADGPVLLAMPARYTRALADAGVPLAALAAPSRGERWTRLPRTGPIDLATMESELDDLLRELARRPVSPAADAADALDRGVSLTAGVALGTLAWLLWRHRERPVPQLALSRFGDLSGLVRFGAETVDVRLPLGRRRSDLSDHGLLTDIPDVPWLNGRTLTFGGT